MMEGLINLFFSKAGAALVGALGILALWLRGAWHKRRAENAEARARTAETRVEIQKVETEYAPEIEHVEKAGESGDAAAVADLINRRWGLRDGKAESHQTGMADAGAETGRGPEPPEDR
jgi:hypothetical protein